MPEEPPDDSVIGARVREARVSRGLSQAQVAEAMRREFRVPWHQTAVAKTEAGDRPLRLGEASALAHVLGVGVAWLAGMPGELPPPVVDRTAEQALRSIIDTATRALGDPARRLGVEVDSLERQLEQLPDGADRSFLEAARDAARAERDAAGGR